MESQEHIFMINSSVEWTRGNRAINAAEDENYGEILKSGDNTLLRYKIFDGDGEILPLEGLPCEAVIKKEDKVVYRTPADVDAENIVNFKITEVLPSDRNDPYTIEFVITQDQDTLIFPSDDRINLYIYPSSLSADGDIIEQTPEARLNEIVIVAVNDATQDFYSEVDNFRDTYNELIDTGVIQENINQKLAASEAEYAPRLTSLEQNDAELTAQLAQIAINVKSFGAKGDGITDDTKTINEAIVYASENGLKEVYIPKGIYMIKTHKDGQKDNILGMAGGINLFSNIVLRLHPQAELKAIPTSHGAHAVVSIKNVENVQIIGGKITGERYDHLGTSGEWGYGISLQNAKNILIENVYISDCWGDGINIQIDGITFGTPCENVTIRNVTADNNRRQGMSIEALVGGVVENCRFINTNGISPQCGVDIEPWDLQNKVENVVFRDCLFDNNNGSGLTVMGGSVKNITVDNCILSNNKSREGDLSMYFGEGFYVSNCKMRRCGSTRVTKLNFIANEVASMVVNNSKDILVQSNRFKTDSYLLGYEMLSVPYYTEEGYTQNMNIIDNTFEGAYTTDGDSIQSVDTGIRIRSGLGVTIRGNKFKNMTTTIDTGGKGEQIDIKQNLFINSLKGLSHNAHATVISENIFEGTPCWHSSGAIYNFNLDKLTKEVVTNNLVYKYPRNKSDYDPNLNYRAYKVLHNLDENKVRLESGNVFFDNSDDIPV